MRFSMRLQRWPDVKLQPCRGAVLAIGSAHAALPAFRLYTGEDLLIIIRAH